MTGSIRCFVAIELPEELRGRIADSIAFLKSGKADVKWVPPENLHFTMKFLGQVPLDDIPRLTGLLKDAVKDIEPFEVEVGGTGVFPRPGSPRVFWVGVNDPDKLLQGLARNMEEVLASAGYGEREKGEFTPHLTIGRLREAGPGNRSRGREEAGEVARGLATLKDVLFGKIKLENISLMRSELGPGGARYSRISEIEFGG